MANNKKRTMDPPPGPSAPTLNTFQDPKPMFLPQNQAQNQQQQQQQQPQQQGGDFGFRNISNGPAPPMQQLGDRSLPAVQQLGQPQQQQGGDFGFRNASNNGSVPEQQLGQPQQQQGQTGDFGIRSSENGPVQEQTPTQRPITERKPIRELLRLRRNTRYSAASTTDSEEQSNALADNVLHVGGIGWSVFSQEGRRTQPSEQFTDVHADHKRKLINSIRSADNQKSEEDAKYNLPHNYVSPAVNQRSTLQARYALSRSQAAASSVQEITAAERTALDSSCLAQSRLASAIESPVNRIKRQEEEMRRQRQTNEHNATEQAQESTQPEETGREMVIQEDINFLNNPGGSSIRFRVDWKAENYLLWVEIPWDGSTIGYLKLWIFCLLFRHRRPELREFTIQEQLRATPAEMTRFMEILTEDGHRYTTRDDHESISILGETGSTERISVVHDEEQVRDVYEKYAKDDSQSSRRSVPRDKVLKFFRRTIAKDVLDGMVERGLGASSSSVPDVDLDNKTRQTLDEAVLPTFPDPQNGYILHPSEGTIRSMSSESDLAAVKDFCITRTGYGSILWLGTTDIRRTDLASMVQFESGNVNVRVDASTMPPGTGINKLVHVTLFNIWPNRLYPHNSAALRHVQTEEDLRLGRWRVPLSTRTKEEKEELDQFYFLLRKSVATDMGGQFVHYDMETGSLSFQLPCFQS